MKNGPRDTATVIATRAWLTPKGCEATGGHRPGNDGACVICGHREAAS